MNYGEGKGKYEMKKEKTNSGELVKEKKEEMKKDEEKKGQKEEVKKIEIKDWTNKETTEKKLMKYDNNDEIKWWQFWKKEAEVKTGTKADIDLSWTGTKIETKKTDVIKQGEWKYTFTCKDSKKLVVYNGKYEIDGQKSSLEQGKIGLYDPQTKRIHFLRILPNDGITQIFEKVVTRLENEKQTSYRYTLSVNEKETKFVKNDEILYSGCKLVK